MREDWQDIIELYQTGEIGDVEFTEMALEAGMSLERIGRELEKDAQEF